MFAPDDNPRIQELLLAIQEIPRDEKIIIWCKFEHEIKDIKSVLESHGESVALCYGKLRAKRRAEEMGRFENGARFLIANKGCAEFGLNLQFCQNEIFYNNDWDWATREQAEDRVWRHGQTHDVRIIDICAVETIDDRILDCILHKENLVYQFKKHLHKKNFVQWLDGKDDEIDTNGADRKAKAG
jgi:SNF2 family DNA or RNA helicase